MLMRKIFSICGRKICSSFSRENFSCIQIFQTIVRSRNKLRRKETLLFFYIFKSLKVDFTATMYRFINTVLGLNFCKFLLEFFLYFWYYFPSYRENWNQILKNCSCMVRRNITVDPSLSRGNKREEKDLQPSLSFLGFRRRSVTCERPCQECNLWSRLVSMLIPLRLYADACMHAHGQQAKRTT